MPTQSAAPAPKLDLATLSTLLSKIDPSVNASTTAAIVKAAGNEAGITRLFTQLDRMLTGQSRALTEADLPALLAEAESRQAKVVNLAALSSTELTQLAAGDAGVRYALIHGLPLAVTGNAAITANLNADGSLHRFDPNTGERLYTDAWLKDRAEFMAVTFKAGGAASLDVTGTQSWVFEERTDAGSTRVTVNADKNQRAANKMVFAASTTTTQTLVGSAGGDKLYSGAGDDDIEAGAGDDYVEGGGGGDLIDGARGSDTLLGGTGDDQIDGGLGDDKLEGGAGADYLVGGAGNDRLDGGAGFDTYVIDSTDGHDVVIDADGQGEIVFDGEVLNGAGALRDGRYTSPNGKFTYAFAGDWVEGGVLTISTETGSVKLVNFKNGQLGINLGMQALVDDIGIEAAGMTGQLGGQTHGRPHLFTSRQEAIDDTSRNDELPTESPVDVVTDPIASLPIAGSDGPVDGDIPITDGDIPAAPQVTSGLAKPRSQAGALASASANTTYSDLFADPVANLALVTGEQLGEALGRDGDSTRDGTPVGPRFDGAVTFLNPAFMSHDWLSARHVEYALMDFHDAMNTDGGLGGDNLGDASSIGVGSLSIGTAFDKPGMGDDKYTDLGSKRIGVKA